MAISLCALMKNRGLKAGGGAGDQESLPELGGTGPPTCPAGPEALRPCAPVAPQSPLTTSRLGWERTSQPPGPLLPLKRRSMGNTVDKRDPPPRAHEVRVSGPVQFCTPTQGLYLFQSLGQSDGCQPQRPEEPLPCARPHRAVRRGPGRG